MNKATNILAPKTMGNFLAT